MGIFIVSFRRVQPQPELPRENLRVPPCKTALLGLELELAQHPGTPQALVPLPCTSPRGHSAGRKATRGPFAGDGVTAPRTWTNSRLFNCFLSP